MLFLQVGDKTPFYWACVERNSELALLLIENGATIDAKPIVSLISLFSVSQVNACMEYMFIGWTDSFITGMFEQSW